MSRSVFFRVKEPQGPWQRYSGNLPFSVTGFEPGTVLEYCVGDGPIREITTLPLTDIADFYGVGPGEIPLRLQSALAILSGGFVQRIPNAGGAGAVFDLFAGTSNIPITAAGAMDLMPARWLRWTNLTQETAINLMSTRVFIVADLRGMSADQYFMGNGSPQTNVWIESGGNRLRLSRRNPVTNTVETVNVNLSPAIAGALRLYEIEFLPGGAPNANGQTSGGSIRVFVNGELRGMSSHTYPTFLAWNYGAGQNPTTGNGLNALVFDTLSLIQGGDYAARVQLVRSELAAEYGITL